MFLQASQSDFFSVPLPITFTALHLLHCQVYRNVVLLLPEPNSLSCSCFPLFQSLLFCHSFPSFNDFSCFRYFLPTRFSVPVSLVIFWSLSPLVYPPPREFASRNRRLSPSTSFALPRLFFSFLPSIFSVRMKVGSRAQCRPVGW